eukprot:1515125-Rhodomonas_salina.3
MIRYVSTGHSTSRAKSQTFLVLIPPKAFNLAVPGEGTHRSNSCVEQSMAPMITRLVRPNQRQKHFVPVQFVPEKRLFVFDFAAKPDGGTVEASTGQHKWVGRWDVGAPVGNMQALFIGQYLGVWERLHLFSVVACHDLSISLLFDPNSASEVSPAWKQQHRT